MKISLTTTSMSTSTSQTIPARDAVMCLAIIVAGFAAASTAMPILWIFTPIIAAMVYHSAQQTVVVPDAVAVEGQLPPVVQASIDGAIAQLPLGEPRQLLANVVRQARPLFADRESSFDKEKEAETRANVVELVDAACDTALELARLDGAAPKTADKTDELSQRYRRAREELVTRLRNAAASLSELYASDIEHGTPSSDRVAELAQELREDARARSAAKGEIEGVVDSV
jgi:hypothetical protein